MSVRDLIPWGREENRVPSLFRDSERDPFLSLHREVNRLFDDVFRGFDGGGGVKDWNSAAETFNVTRELVRRGYTEQQIGQLWSGNLLRVMAEVEKRASR